MMVSSLRMAWRCMESCRDTVLVAAVRAVEAGADMV